MSDHQFDYVIVGSGAGGGPLAANLAKEGYRVCLMEAGQRPRRNLANTNVPVFHAFSTEDPHLGWYSYVRHYKDENLQQEDDKFQNSDGVPDPRAPDNGEPPLSSDMHRYPKWQPKNGVFYPRASALGGCTTHHALITVYPHNSDWEQIVEKTGDWTWNPQNMRRYFEQLERCNYRPIAKFFAKVFSFNPTRHGFNGWLPTKIANLKLLKRDKQLQKLLLDSVMVAHEHVTPNPLRRLLRTLVFKADANTWGIVKRNAEGFRVTALSIDRKLRRSAAREYVEAVERTHPANLTIKTGVLVEKVLFADEKDEQDNWVANGVRYYEGDDLHEAAASYDPEAALGEPKEIHVNREVILAGGAYSTPQILMLSGIGDHNYLRQLIEQSEIKKDTKFRMKPGDLKVCLPGVGRNLQDRYEVGLVQRMKQNFKLLKGATYTDNPDDPHYDAWQKGEDGVYATNGAIISLIKKSKPERALPDLYIFGVLAPFRGYEPGYSAKIRETHRAFTWAILKAHTENRAGFVKLNEDDPFNPRRLPQVNFKYFSEGSDAGEDDLESMVEGVKFVRSMVREAEEVIEEEEYPGLDRVPTNDDQKIRAWVSANAWGHHASCTCPIGLRSHSEKENGKGYLAVLDSKFRVFGTKNLRVVDASVFPRIPGFFIVLPIFMISQKAAEQIHLDAQLADRKRRENE